MPRTLPSAVDDPTSVSSSGRPPSTQHYPQSPPYSHSLQSAVLQEEYSPPHSHSLQSAGTNLRRAPPSSRDPQSPPHSHSLQSAGTDLRRAPPSSRDRHLRFRHRYQNAGASIPGYYSNSEATEKSVDAALGTLMQHAHDGDERLLTLVQLLCSEAHGTPARRRTYGQRYVLSRWRNPLRACSNLHPLLTNPKFDDPPTVWQEYYTQYIHALPKGVRINTETGVPVYGDVVASRLLARLRPSNSHYRAEFNIAVINLFIYRGQFRQLVQDGQVWIPHIADVYHTFQPEGRADWCTISVLDVARHFAKCGVSIEEIENFVEPWIEEFAKSSVLPYEFSLFTRSVTVYFLRI
ncbi:hypothetical protein C8J55DRAFT_493285 [Lentinula edodes]|uniref:Uncharacterized protein n=1 Tax=Lentinula lateritia TaxID=40482 RepID=A0A9W9DE87_9AGAR|nr:hypothetical protein C8J55DRAFT_493285 [Lentinula edodes]